MTLSKGPNLPYASLRRFSRQPIDPHPGVMPAQAGIQYYHAFAGPQPALE
jgi:hypothetical protein